MIPFGTPAEGVEILHHEPAIVTGTASVAMVDEKVSLGVGGVTWRREEEKDVLTYKRKKKNTRRKIVAL